MLTSLEAANRIIEQKDLQIQELTKKLHSTQLSLTMLQHQVEQLIRRVYGRRSEKLHPDQLSFDSLMLQVLNQPVTEPEPLVELPVPPEPPKQRPVKVNRRHPGRIPIPEHLERREIVLDIPEQAKVCPVTGKPLKLIDWEVSEKLTSPANSWSTSTSGPNTPPRTAWPPARRG